MDFDTRRPGACAAHAVVALVAATGWSVLTNPWQHIVVPVLAVGVWAIWGPRGWVSLRLARGHC